MTGIIERASRVVLDLLFPPRCALCGRGGVLLCDGCAATLPPADGDRCERCWMPVARATLCRHCYQQPPAFESIRAAFVMDGPARRLAHELKYEGMTSLAEPMAELMAACADVAEADVVVPVPLHPARERSRGYNQASELARHLAAVARLPYEARASCRLRDTAALARTMHRDERRAIVAGAFAADRGRIDGRRLLLVDDVVTTGATLDACAGALRAAGASAVRCVTWARAD
ncbi:MAG: ComF family protein [Dehalococcoidia bacterium]|nr:MAG: ComF family protein [Dehalococcoidia bacterium]